MTMHSPPTQSGTKRRFAEALLLSVACAASSFTISAAPASSPKNAAGSGGQAEGFRAGTVLISFMGGMTVSAEGSLLEHERRYHETLAVRIQALSPRPITLLGLEYSIPPFAQVFRYRPIGQFDVERAVGDRFGIGLSVFHFSIVNRSQDVRTIPTASSGAVATRDYIDPLPTERRLYQGTVAAAQFVLHPFSRTALDPYVAARFGVGGFSGNAHADLTVDPTRLKTEVSNGRALVAGGAVGMNFHFSGEFGVRLEGSAYRQILQADVYSVRGLSSYHLQAGLFLNVGAL